MELAKAAYCNWIIVFLIRRTSKCETPTERPDLAGVGEGGMWARSFSVNAKETLV